MSESVWHVRVRVVCMCVRTLWHEEGVVRESDRQRER